MPNIRDNHPTPPGRGISTPRLPLRGHSRNRPRAASLARPRAFTLVEIMVVLAIVAMGSSVLIVGATRLFSDAPTRPADVFWHAVTAARKQALQSGRDVRLTFAPAGSDEAGDMPSALVATWENGGARTFPFEKNRDVICEFLSTQKAVSSVIIAGELVETHTIGHITFYDDGTCTPCRVQFRIGGGSPQVLAIDPWTCAEMFSQPEGGP